MGKRVSMRMTRQNVFNSSEVENRMSVCRLKKTEDEILCNDHEITEPDREVVHGFGKLPSDNKG